METTLKELKDLLDKAGYGNRRDYPKIDLYIDGRYEGTTTWAKTCKVAKARKRLQVGLLDKCKIEAVRQVK